MTVDDILEKVVEPDDDLKTKLQKSVSSRMNKIAVAKIDQQNAKDAIKEIIKKTHEKVKINVNRFTDIQKIEKEKLKFKWGIGKFLDMQDNNKNSSD